MSWIDALVANLKELVAFLAPLRVIRSYERGVVLRLGVPHRVMAPGLRWLWPLHIEECQVVIVVEQTMDLQVQNITTKDDRSVTLSANMVYCVVDPILYHTAVTDFDRSAEGFARIHLAKRVRDRTFAELVAEQSALERSLEGTMSTRLAKWGAEVQSFGFTDLTVSRAFRVFGDTPRLP